MIKHTLIALSTFTFISLTGQERNSPSDLLKQYEEIYQKRSNANLLSFSLLAKENPVFFLETIPSFYAHQAQNQSWNAYIQSPLLKIKKALAYAQLSRTINQQVYGQYANEIMYKMNQPIPEFISATDGVEIHEWYEQKLATLTDDPQLAQQASTQFSREWPFHVLPIDLESYKNKLAELHQDFENQKQQLTLAEQHDGGLEKFKFKLESEHYALDRAIRAIVHRDTITHIQRNPLAFIIEHIKLRNLAQELKTCTKVFPLKMINTLLKGQHKNGNGLLHEVCINSELTSDQKIYAVYILENHVNDHDGININEHNNTGKTPLDLIERTKENEPIRNALISLGAQHSLPKVTQIKKSNSYSTPATEITKAKSKQLRFSADTKLENNQS